MRRSRPARTGVAALLVVGAVLVGVLDHQSSASSSTAAEPAPAPPAVPPMTPAASDGVVDGDISAFDDRHPAVANLDATLLAAVRRASTAANRDGVQLLIESGWRSAVYQQRLLDDAIARYGSVTAAARWVATPDTSPHVSGDAVDIAPAGAAAWLARYGDRFGLCRIYRNEPWHFERRASAVEHGCPRPYADPTHDPRMQG